MLHVPSCAWSSQVCELRQDQCEVCASQVHTTKIRSKLRPNAAPGSAVSVRASALCIYASVRVRIWRSQGLGVPHTGLAHLEFDCIRRQGGQVLHGLLQSVEACRHVCEENIFFDCTQVAHTLNHSNFPQRRGLGSYLCTLCDEG